MKITIKHIFLGLMFTTSSLMAQLVVSADDFARNPSRYNGRQIVIRNVPISKISGGIQLNGPKALSGTSPTSSTVNSTSSMAVVPSGGSPQNVSISPSSPGNTNTAPAPTAITTRVNKCTPPRNWEMINVDIANHDACFVMYSRMARTIVANRQVNADITFLVDTRLMHRITRVKINP